jgi:mRNA interferase MazF
LSRRAECSPSAASSSLDFRSLISRATTGLKVPSLLRFDTLATLDRFVIACGAAPAAWLHAHRAVFFGVFGFGQS